jgi:hypothetical protein
VGEDRAPDRPSDIVDAGLDTLVTPLLTAADGRDVAQAFLSGVLSGLLGTANCGKRSDKIGISVGAMGFPAGGVMGAGIEIALAPSDAMGFLQTEFLDLMVAFEPFFGYVSIRLCSRTATHLGVQQFGDADNACSVMIEIVSYATEGARLQWPLTPSRAFAPCAATSSSARSSTHSSRCHHRRLDAAPSTWSLSPLRGALERLWAAWARSRECSATTRAGPLADVPNWACARLEV